MTEIVLGDLVDIQQSHFILVNATRPSWGTAMEVHDAASRGLPVIAWVGEARVSPWLRYFCKEIHATLEAAVASINQQAA